MTWVGDHPPRHVHVYQKGKLVVKWDLVSKRAMKGAITAQLLKLIERLEKEGAL